MCPRVTVRVPSALTVGQISVSGPHSLHRQAQAAGAAGGAPGKATSRQHCAHTEVFVRMLTLRRSSSGIPNLVQEQPTLQARGTIHCA